MKTFRLLLIAATLAAASLPLAAQVNDTYVIPAAANQQGAFGTHWMTRFSIFNPHLDYPLVVSITLLPTNGAPGIEELVELPPNALAYSDNILDDLFDVQQGSGALLVATFAEDNPDVPDEIISRAFLVNSETYNNHPSGTYGQTIPGVWTGLLDYETDGISSVAQGIRNGGRWRTNVGMVNLGRCSVTVHVTAYDADGDVVLDDAPFGVPPLAHFQDALPVALDNGSVEFFVVDPCTADDDLFAVVFPYTSTIDRNTGDPSYQSPTLLANPSILYSKGAMKIDPQAVGKKIDSSYARGVRASAERRGKATLTKSAQGWAISR